MSDCIRLSVALARAGVASRRAADELILSGRITVNGQKVVHPYQQVSPADTIAVDGAPVQQEEAKVAFIINKPRGYLCEAIGSCRGRSVLSLFGGVPYRLFTVGRLDRDTEGLLIVTNDGELAHRVLHPSFSISREYLVKVGEEVLPEHLESLSDGVAIDGRRIRPKKVVKLRRGTLKITVSEGKKREVRLLVANAGLRLLELTRIRIGPLHLGKLPLGQWRPLTSQERKALLREEENDL